MPEVAQVVNSRNEYLGLGNLIPEFTFSVAILNYLVCDQKIQSWMALPHTEGKKKELPFLPH